MNSVDYVFQSRGYLVAQSGHCCRPDRQTRPPLDDTRFGYLHVRLALCERPYPPPHGSWGEGTEAYRTLVCASLETPPQLSSNHFENWRPAVRVFLVTHETSRTGAPRVAILVARGLVEQGHAVHILARSPGPLLPEFQSIAPTSVEFLHRVRRKLRSIPATRLIAYLLDTTVATATLLRRRADLVYVNSTAAAIYLRPARWLHRRVILHVHESGDLAAWFLAKAQAKTPVAVDVSVVACSPSVQAEIAALMKRTVDDVPMLPSVPDDAGVLRLSAEQPDHDYSPDEFVVGCCGAVEHRKGADVWVEVARQVREATLEYPVRFVWVGEGTQTVRPDEESKIAFIGPSPNPYAHMRRFDVFTLPSRDDPFPLVVLEAMLLGTPVVAFAVGGVPQQVGDAGIVVPNGDVAAFAREIVRLLKDECERRRLGSAAEARVKDLYSTDSFIAALSHLVKLDANHGRVGSAVD